uniref:Conserved domain protein n=1 Tax=Strongyloides papillosus TaxID=174720 RepID=A0A0N5BIX5_STREA
MSFYDFNKQVDFYSNPSLTGFGTFLRDNCTPSLLEVFVEKSDTFVIENCSEVETNLLEELIKELKEGKSIFGSLYKIAEENGSYAYEALYYVYEDIIIREALKENFVFSLETILLSIEKGNLCGEIFLSAIEGNSNLIYDVLGCFNDFSRILLPSNKPLYYCSIHTYVQENRCVPIPQEIENVIISMNELGKSKKASDRYIRKWMHKYISRRSLY